jgi:predicted O-linked N-acetylglucosamine transferase (SPINDLY family)
MEKKNFTCEKCKKSYKTRGRFNKHICSIVKKKNKIAPQLRFLVWKKYIGNKIESKCFCCLKHTITPFTYLNTFHTGHIISEYNGGSLDIGNLLPICNDCNKSMGVINWDEYIKSSTNFRVRIYGDNIPKSTHDMVYIIQSWYKNIKKSSREKNKKKKKKNKKKRKLKKKKVGYLRDTISSIMKKK